MPKGIVQGGLPYRIVFTPAAANAEETIVGHYWILADGSLGQSPIEPCLPGRTVEQRGTAPALGVARNLKVTVNIPEPGSCEVALYQTGEAGEVVVAQGSIAEDTTWTLNVG